MILEMLWLAHHNPEIDWRTGEVKITRCLEECGKQWRLKQRKSGWQKQKEKEKRKEVRREGVKRERKEEKETKKGENDGGEDSSRGIGNLGWTGKNSKVWKRGQEIGSSKILQINLYLWKEGKWENANKEVVGSCNRGERRICIEEGKGVSVVKRREVHEFIKEQLRKGYIKLSKLLQMAFIFFVGEKNNKKRMVQDYRYLNEWTSKTYNRIITIYK